MSELLLSLSVGGYKLQSTWCLIQYLQWGRIMKISVSQEWHEDYWKILNFAKTTCWSLGGSYFSSSLSRTERNYWTRQYGLAWLGDVTWLTSGQVFKGSITPHGEIFLIDFFFILKIHLWIYLKFENLHNSWMKLSPKNWHSTRQRNPIYCWLVLTNHQLRGRDCSESDQP
jgi:hypothetical protein